MKISLLFLISLLYIPSTVSCEELTVESSRQSSRISEIIFLDADTGAILVNSHGDLLFDSESKALEPKIVDFRECQTAYGCGAIAGGGDLPKVIDCKGHGTSHVSYCINNELRECTDTENECICVGAGSC